MNIQPIKTRPTSVGGEQRLYRFPNGYGASVIRTPYSYGGDEGLWELGVTKYHAEGHDAWNLTYETPITDDVLGWLTEEDVTTHLEAIASLPRP